MNKKWMATCGLLALFAMGCADDPADTPPVVEEGHNHGEGHHHAETFPEAVAEMVALRNTIRDGFANEDPDAAHGPLHDVGHVLVEVEAMAEKEGLDAETLTGVRDAVETLKESFASVDKMMHGGEGSEYSEVSADVDAAMAVLVAASGADEDGHAEGGHEAHEAHEGHDGDEGHGEGHDEAHGDHEDGHAEGGDHEAHEDGHADEDHGEEKK